MYKFATRTFVDFKQVFDLVLENVKYVKEYIIFLVLVSLNSDTPKNQFAYSNIIEEEHFLTQSTIVSIINHNSLF